MTTYIRRKYLKPKSLTWWASFIPLLAGLFLAIAPIWPSTAALVTALADLTGNVSAVILINAGIAGIGLRGAMP